MIPLQGFRQVSGECCGQFTNKVNGLEYLYAAPGQIRPKLKTP
jgi:hypothetical protein